MEYQKIKNLLDSTPNQPTKFRTKNFATINNDACTTYNSNSQSRIKTSMWRSNLFDFSDVYIRKRNYYNSASATTGSRTK